MSDVTGRKIPLKSPARILLVRNDNIGDVVCTLPAISLLRARLPDAFIGLVVCSLTEEVAAGCPDIDRLFVYEKAKHVRPEGPLRAWRGMLAMFRDLRAHGFEVAVGLKSRYSGSQGWIVFMSRARIRLGRRPGKPGFASNKFFNHTLAEDYTRVHEAVKTAGMLAPLGVDAGDPPPARIALHDEHFEEFRGFIKRHAISKDRPLVMVNVSGRPEEGRTWPGESFLRLAALLGDMDARVVFSAAPGDAASVRALLGRLDPQPPLFSSASLKSFSAALSLCDIFVTVQGGPMHLAAGVGARVVALFGRQDPEIWHPWKVRHRVLIKEGSLAAIEPEDAARAVKELLDETESPN